MSNKARSSIFFKIIGTFFFKVILSSIAFYFSLYLPLPKLSQANDQQNHDIVIMLRSSKIIIKNYFYVHYRNSQKSSQYLKRLFFKISLGFGTSNWVSTYWKQNLLVINDICLVFSFLEMQRRFIKTNVYYKLFDSYWKETNHKSSCSKNIFFQYLCYW